MNTRFDRTITHTVPPHWTKQSAEDLSFYERKNRNGISSVYLISEFVEIKQRSHRRNKLGDIVECGGNRSQVIHMYCSHAGG